MSSRDQHGKRVGPDNDPDRFLLDHEVAKGAEGKLFRASITVSGLTLEVAIKQLLSECTPVNEWQERWARQVELLRTLQGPGVVPVREGFAGPLPHGIGETCIGRTLYLVMNWVEGEPLHEWVQHRPQEDPFETVERLLTVATALDDMHAGKTTGGTPVLHRDIKPSNILVNEAGAVVVDFGLIRALPDGPRISGVSGTPGYMPPESLNDGIYAPASDRYSFGAVAYFVFTRTEPPWGHNPDVLRANLSAAPALARRPEAVDRIMEALDADPNARPDSLREWVIGLRASAPGPPPPVPRPDDTRERARKLRVALIDLAEAYIALEGDGNFALIRAQVDGDGPSAPAAREVVASIGQFWEKYAVAKRFLDDLDAAIAAGRGPQAHRLLGPHAITLADGTKTDADALWTDLQDRLTDAEASVRQQADVARDHLELFDASRGRVRDIHPRACALGAAEDAEVTAVLTALAEAETAFTHDPWAAHLTADLDRAIEVASRHVEGLEARRGTLPGRLADARSQLERISALIPEGAEALREAIEKISEPKGLLEPLDPSGVEGGGELALRPWLARIEHLDQAGRWRAADQGLQHWQTVADGWLANATAVLEANRRPKAERDLLRGRLKGFRAKAAQMGRSEDPKLTLLHRAAFDELSVAPCDLPTARTRVQEYIDAVNDPPEENEPPPEENEPLPEENESPPEENEPLPEEEQ